MCFCKYQSEPYSKGNEFYSRKEIFKTCFCSRAQTSPELIRYIRSIFHKFDNLCHDTNPKSSHLSNLFQDFFFFLWTGKTLIPATELQTKLYYPDKVTIREAAI